MKTDKKSLMRKSVALANHDILAKDLKRVQTIGRSRISATAILEAFANKPQMTINEIVDITKYARKNVINSVHKLVDMGILHPTLGKQRNEIYSYSEMIGQAGELSMNNTRTQNKNGTYLNFAGRDYAIRQADTKTKVKFKPDNRHNNKLANKNSKNLLCVGDNLATMKWLMPEHKDSFDLIYVDSPYNQPTARTPRMYNDSFDGDCDFLSFMYPRLMLCQRLLNPKGLIAVSIGEDEMAQVKLIMNEIFGQENFINNITIEDKIAAGPMSGYTKYKLPNVKSYLLVYARDKSNINFLNRLYDPIASKFATDYNTIIHPDLKKEPLLNFLKNNPTATQEFKTHNLPVTLKNVENLMQQSAVFEAFMYEKVVPILYKATTPQSKALKTPLNCPPDAVFILDDKLVELKENGVLCHYKPFINRLQKNDDGEPINSLIRGDVWKGYYVYKNSVQNEGGVMFTGKKPIALIRDLLKWIGNKEAKVLDIFAGSGTTGHTVMLQNRLDGGQRTFILCQTAEIINPESKEYNQGFKTIDQATTQRLKNAVFEVANGDGFQIMQS
ncbi:MAG: site-specific DNA-methyltransferase [Alphaproteobacteria bacterium]|nr:site-specific DNA-methyltransferase [Alphaproteobacteria bacterium]